MLRGCWRYITKAGLALAGLAAFAIFAVASYYIIKGLGEQKTHEVQASQAAQKTYDRAKIQVQRDCGPLSAVRQQSCEQQIQNAYEADKREIDDLEAQRITATWTAYMGAAALLGMAISVIGVGLVWTTFRTASEANKIARDTLTAENRAWIEVAIDSHGPLRFEGGEIRLKVFFKFKNIGHSVAVHVGPWAGLIPDPITKPAEESPVKKFSEDMRRNPPDVFSQTVFPTRESSLQEWDVSISTEDAAIEPGSDCFLIALCVGVQYTTIFDRPGDPPHQTIQVANLFRLDDENVITSIIGTSPVPADKLALVRPTRNYWIVS